MRKIENELSLQDARHAIVTAVQILRHTPVEKLADIYKSVHGHRIENARVAIHADMHAQMFELALKAIDELSKSEPDQQETCQDSCPEDSA